MATIKKVTVKKATNKTSDNKLRTPEERLTIDIENRYVKKGTLEALIAKPFSEVMSITSEDPMTSVTFGLADYEKVSAVVSEVFTTVEDMVKSETLKDGKTRKIAGDVETFIYKKVETKETTMKNPAILLKKTALLKEGIAPDDAVIKALEDEYAKSTITVKAKTFVRRSTTSRDITTIKKVK